MRTPGKTLTPRFVDTWSQLRQAHREKRLFPEFKNVAFRIILYRLCKPQTKKVINAIFPADITYFVIYIYLIQ